MTLALRLRDDDPGAKEVAMMQLGILLVVVVLVGAYLWARRQDRIGGPPGATGGALGKAPPGLVMDLERWVAAGLLSREQAHTITAFESRQAGAPRRISLVTEALGYVGALLAVAGGGVAVGQVWEDLADGARLAILAGAAAILLVAGWTVRRSDEPALHRLVSVLWLLSVGAASWAMFIAVVDILAVEEGLAPLLVGAAVTGYAVLLWMAHRRALQQVALLGGVYTTVLGALAAAPGEAPEWSFALLFWGVGLGWTLLGWNRIVAPVWAALPLGALGMLIGPAIGAESEGWLFLPALTTAAGLMAVSVLWRHTPLMAVGAVGMFAYVTWSVVEYFGEQLGVPLALTLAGVFVLALAVVAARLRTFNRPEKEPSSGPV